jgi:pyruvate dehydrogenase E1 component beta subunit
MWRRNKMSTKREITYSQSLNEALKEEMERDENVMVMGEDIGVFGGIFKVTKDLLEMFGPERVKDTPISENAIIGAALGASLLGLVPVAEIMYMDFLNECGDQLINHLPKMHYMSGGKLTTPMTIRTQYSIGRHTGAQHSQFFPSFFMNNPGLNIIVPSTPYDAKGLLKTAIRRNDPSLFLESAILYSSKGNVPTNDYTIPFGEARTHIEGDDVVIISISMMLEKVLSAANKLKDQNISCLVIDPRTLNPLDKNGIIDAVKRTNRVVIVEPGHKTAGVGAEISAIIAEEAIEYLDAPIMRVASPNIPAPFSPNLLENYLPTEEKIINSVNKIAQ